MKKTNEKKIYDLIFEQYYPLITGTKKPNVKEVTDEYAIPYDEIISHKDFGATLKPGTIMVDIDEMDNAKRVQKILEKLKINTVIIQTDSGMHFHFTNTNIKSNKQHYYTPIGIKTETKYPHSNVVTPIRLNNENRKILKASDKLDKLPVWLMPLSKRFTTDFSKMQEGDGRNDTLFSYILTLQQQAMTKDEIRSTIKVINQFVLKEPISDKELEVILRDKAFLKESFYLKGKLQYEKLASYLIREHHVVKINDTLHVYKDGYYTSEIDEIERIMLQYIVNSTRTPRLEVLRYLELKTEGVEMESPTLISLKNGVLNLETKQLLDFTPDYKIKNKVPFNYNPVAYSEIMDKTLNKICCSDKNLRLLIEEMIGYTLFRRNELGKCFILTGHGANGKSTLLDVIKKLLGKENISSVALNELNDRFRTFQLEGKLVNIGDDISNGYIDDNSTFKKLVTGETVNVERKGKDPFDFNNYSKLIFSCNEIPRINDLSDGLKRRIIFIPFNAKFSKHDKDYDPFIIDKLLSNESLEYLLKLALDGLERILYNRSFTHVDSVDEAWNDYERRNNPIIGFLEEGKIENEATKDVYLQYQIYCSDNGLKHLSRIAFSREICKHGYKTKQVKIDKKHIQIFINKGEGE
ncbi:putative DNA primase/helicase [Clostridium cavendishii DSM 21758]|uniref:Putative DNA primase/helicase n=1 Tax=Clostridium cavendishii DSM 21758 TaxID=1121302 RepID=A0A1M6S2V6_9CLOT|nr:phage/plasmid primase, P4 family [Clostridium cavendishii]SHK38838.1 putative DNA primase/helicase [Clostridium cavendishii DSM 21758]